MLLWNDVALRLEVDSYFPVTILPVEASPQVQAYTVFSTFYSGDSQLEYISYVLAFRNLFPFLMIN